MQIREISHDFTCELKKGTVWEMLRNNILSLDGDVIRILRLIDYVEFF